MLSLALGIALWPPLWAVLAPVLGVTTGAVALICAGVYAARGNQTSEAARITLGFWLCGWAIGLTIMGNMQVSELGNLPLQIGAAMLVGVVYVGMGVEFFRKKIVHILAGRKGL